MNRSMMFFLTVAFVAALFTIANSPPANADWSDNFDGGLQQTWQFGNFNAISEPSLSFIAGGLNDQLVMSDTVPPASGGAVGAFGVVLDTLADVRMEGTINLNGDTATSATVTLIARGNVLTQQFYGAEVDYDSGNLYIFRNDSIISVTDLVEAPIPGLTTDDSIHLVFSLLGDSLSLQALDAPGGTVLASVMATDATYAAGLSGVLVAANAAPTAPMLGVWDDVSATTIPEPATLMLTITAALGALLAGRRRWR